MVADDDHTLVGEQTWQDLGERELIRLAQPTLLDPQTARDVQALCRAMGALCWAKVAAMWLFIAVAVVVLAGLFVGVVQGPPAP